jgi:cyclic pyranopterin phosphate synthase
LANPNYYQIYTDGSCKGNPGPGGWAAIIIKEGTIVQKISGNNVQTTNNQMEITAVIEGLKYLEIGSSVEIFSDSTYVINSMTKNWKRNVNKELWTLLDSEASKQSITWHWVKGHSGNPGNELADKLAYAASELAEKGIETVNEFKSDQTLTHIDENGNASMVDVGNKDITVREATATSTIIMKPETLKLIQDGLVNKGDVFTVAKIAGIMGAKKTSELIPLCHPLPLDKVEIELSINEKSNSITILGYAKTSGKTGVEMEALTAVSIAALTIYDMAKASDRQMVISDIKVMKKSGGRSGNLDFT